MKLKELNYERYVLSTRPTLWLPLYRKGGNTFLSSDGYGHVCTVTGATWGQQGRTFDGIDDLINCGRITQIEGAAALWTIRCWCKLTDNLTNNRCLFSYDDNEVLGTADLYAYWTNAGDELYCQIGGGGLQVQSTITDLDDLNWHLIEMSKTSTNLVIREDGVDKYNAAHAGDAFTANHTFRIADNSNINHWKGEVGEIYILAGRTGSLAEHIQYRQATKWRYS